MMKDGMLEVGDRLYYTRGWGVRGKKHIITVARVTATQAIANGYRMKRKYCDGTPEIDKYSTLRFYLVTPEVEAAIIADEQLEAIREVVRGYSLTANQIARIHAIINETTAIAQNP
jgi:hypothetical protein